MGKCKIQGRDELGQKKRTPKGHIVVYVGEEMSRFVVPISCLKNPQFQRLLDQAAEVYGFHSNGGIVLPCSHSTFFRVLNFKHHDHTTAG
ncbi:SAUR-like auxin-responsive protein family [Perilla frutescens var. frutescens]|nr:SAUR-like auxin-responsive protein family [Perilla frutescens var. frutescens]